MFLLEKVQQPLMFLVPSPSPARTSLTSPVCCLIWVARAKVAAWLTFKLVSAHGIHVHSSEQEHALCWTGEGSHRRKALQEAAVCMRGWLSPCLWNTQGMLRQTEFIFIPVSVNYSWRIQPLVNHPLHANKYNPYFIPSWENRAN